MKDDVLLVWKDVWAFEHIINWSPVENRCTICTICTIAGEIFIFRIQKVWHSAGFKKSVILTPKSNLMIFFSFCRSLSFQFQLKMLHFQKMKFDQKWTLCTYLSNAEKIMLIGSKL